MPDLAPLASADVSRLGKEIYQRVVAPALHPEDHGKYVAIDIVSEDYEMDSDDYIASQRLRARCPTGTFWLMMVGFPTAYRFAGAR